VVPSIVMLKMSAATQNATRPRTAGPVRRVTTGWSRQSMQGRSDVRSGARTVTKSGTAPRRSVSAVVRNSGPVSCWYLSPMALSDSASLPAWSLMPPGKSECAWTTALGSSRRASSLI